MRPIGADEATIGGETSVNNPTDGNGDGDTNGDSITLSSQTPGAAVQITIASSTATAILPNQDITVDLSAFSVPSTIADSAIDISSDGFDGNPNNVVVSGKKVTLTVPNVKANGDDQTENVVGKLLHQDQAIGRGHEPGFRWFKDRQVAGKCPRRR